MNLAVVLSPILILFHVLSALGILFPYIHWDYGLSDKLSQSQPQQHLLVLLMEAASHAAWGNENVPPVPAGCVCLRLNVCALCAVFLLPLVRVCYKLSINSSSLSSKVFLPLFSSVQKCQFSSARIVHLSHLIPVTVAGISVFQWDH